MGREETLTQHPGCQRPPGPPQLHLAGQSGTGRMRWHTPRQQQVALRLETTFHFFSEKQN